MRRRYYGKKLPKVACIPFICPAKTEPTSTQLLAVDDYQYKEGEEVNWWFVPPSELASYNFGTEAAPLRPIDVNIIDIFNKKRRYDGQYCYSCMPGTIAGYEEYTHNLPNYGCDYTILETLENGVRKRTAINNDTSTNVVDNYDSRTLWLGKGFDNNNKPVTGKLYYAKFYSADGNIMTRYTLEATSEGLKHNGKILDGISTEIDEDGEYYALLNNYSVELGSDFPQWFSAEVKIITQAAADIGLFCVIGLKTSEGNRTGVSVNTASDATYHIVNSYLESTNYKSITLTGDITKKLTVRVTCNAYSNNDRVVALEGNNKTNSEKLPLKRALYHKFTKKSYQRVVIVNSKTAIMALRPTEHAVWLFTGLCNEHRYTSIGKPNTFRVIHINPLINLKCSIHTFQSLSTRFDSCLLRNCDLAGSAFYATYIKNVYIFKSANLNTTVGQSTDVIPMNNVERYYIDNNQYFVPQSISRYIEYGPNATNYILKNEETDEAGIRKGDAVYYKNNDDGSYILISVHQDGGILKLTDELYNGNEVFHYKIMDGCKHIAQRSFYNFLKNNSSKYYTLDFNEVVKIGSSALYSYGRFLGNKKEPDGTYSYDINTNLELGATSIAFLTFFGDSIYFSGDNEIDLKNRFSLTSIKSTNTNIFFDKVRDAIEENSSSKVFTTTSNLGKVASHATWYITTKYPYFIQASSVQYSKLYVNGDNNVNYELIGDTGEEKDFRGLKYKHYNTVYYNDGTHKFLIYHNNNSGEESFELREGYKIAEFASGQGLAMFRYNSSIRTLDISKGHIDKIMVPIVSEWRTGGVIKLPQTIDLKAGVAIGNSYTALNGGELTVYMPKYDNIENIPFRYGKEVGGDGSGKDIVFINPELDKVRVVVHVPSSQASLYEDRGWGEGFKEIVIDNDR